jgi:hypothetical protein
LIMAAPSAFAGQRAPACIQPILKRAARDRC